MDATVQGVLEAFQGLTSEEQRRVGSEIMIQQSHDLDLPPLDQESIDRIADESFLEYDLREESHE